MNPTAAFQHRLAQAVRHPEHDSGLDSERIAVYRRLVRNNLFGFIRRCYTETARHAAGWDGLLETYAAEGSPESPYFQDIAAEFLQFCRQRQALPPHLLALMDLEAAQLEAEVTQAEDARFHPDDDTPHTLHASVCLRDYPPEYAGLLPENTLSAHGKMIVWRDSIDNVWTEHTDDTDYLLLSLCAGEAVSFNRIAAQLAAVMPPDTDWRTVLHQRWQHRGSQGILTAQGSRT